MTLRVRLLLGYGYLVALLLLTAGSATLGFLTLSAGIDTILEENFRSISASTRMVESLERQDSATLAALLDPAADRRPLERFAEEFEAGLAEALANITEEQEEEILRQIGDQYAAYRAAREVLLAEAHERPLVAYEAQVAPTFNRVKESVFRLLNVNHQAMIEADQAARRTAVRSGAWLGFLVTVALLSLIFLSRAMQRHILSRLADLSEMSAAVARGDTRRRLLIEGDDELADLARHFNSSLDRHAELGAQMAGKISQEKQLALGLLDALQRPAVILGLDGRNLARSRHDLPAAWRRAVEEWVEDEGRDVLNEAPTGAAVDARVIDTGDGNRARVRLLLAEGVRPVAWLAELEAGRTDAVRDTGRRGTVRPA